MSEALTGTNGGDAPRDRIAELQEDWRLEVQLHSKTKAQLAAMKQERDRLKEALSLLYDHQNGCPLPSYEYGWTRAMEMAELALRGTQEP